MSQSASPQEEKMAAIGQDDIHPVVVKFFSRLPVDKWESLNKSTSDDGIKIYVAEFILDLVDVLTKSLLVAMKNNNFIISEEVVWSILGNTLPQTIADFLDIKDTVECASATSLTRLLVKEAVTSVKSAVSCNSQAEGFMESEHVTSHHRLDVMVGHAIRMLRTIGAKMKGLFRFRLRKEKRAMETSTDGQKGDDVNDEKSHESSGPSKTSEVDYTLFQTPVAPLFQTSETGSAHSKTSETLDKVVYKDLVRIWGCAESVVVTFNMEGSSEENCIASIFKARLMSQPKKRGAVCKFLRSVGKAISKPFRRSSEPVWVL
ncbi:3-ketoacyl-CoA thiolase [Dissostichus eleginoides]|uniref:3-ketoacyl-CoA thiolase n=1 Tax=Dissostichus eleginoides TaxID=100907 RepID=A0AAD9C8A5_DISEL|nr:3-ketoacyl-CoA thiolase [Dissostichus eleginoides]